MRRLAKGLLLVLGLGFWSGSAQSQTVSAGFSDPFFLYYGFFLPRQAALAAQPQPEDQIRAQSAQRQFQAETERSGLYDPLGTIGEADLDPSRPFGRRSGSSRIPRTTPLGIANSNLQGKGPASHYNRTGTYYPRLRNGQSRRASGGTAISGVRGGSLGGAGVPGGGFGGFPG